METPLIKISEKNEVITVRARMKSETLSLEIKHSSSQEDEGSFVLELGKEQLKQVINDIKGAL